MFRINVRDYGAIGNGHIDDTSAFERALVDIYERYPDRNFPYTGELFIPNGIYRLTRGLRGPANYIQVSCRRPRGTTSPNISVAGPDTNHGRFRLEIERGGGLGIATFRWSPNWGRTWETGVTIPAGGSYTLGTTAEGITVTFPAGDYTPTTEYFWPGNGAYPLPPHCRIAGEHLVKTVLSFDFSVSGGRGDGIRMVWNPVQQSGRFVEIRDLTLENTSSRNRLDNNTVRREGTAPPPITVSGHPYRDDFEFKIEITRAGRLGTATFRYSTDNGRTWLRVDWATPSVDVVVQASVQLVGTGVTVHFPDATYSTDNVYTWNVTGYAVTDGGGVGAFWKLRVLARKVGGVSRKFSQAWPGYSGEEEEDKERGETREGSEDVKQLHATSRRGCGKVIERRSIMKSLILSCAVFFSTISLGVTPSARAASTPIQWAGETTDSVTPFPGNELGARDNRLTTISDYYYRSGHCS